MNLIQMDEKLKNTLSERRYIHSIGVMESAISLAERFGEDIDKARIAGLLHDCAKEVDKDEAVKLCDELGIDIDDAKRVQKGLLHADLGAELIKTEYDISDSEIYDAIKYHTMGRENMTMLDKIIYLADFIEPSRRDFEGLTELRKLCMEDLDEAMLFAINLSISFVLNKGKVLHKQTLATRDYFQKLKEEKGR
ncbi:MAG: bis(5'-nucleosyl)-tetraphosphatase (symmetrical) YqeK [Clostridia bacterium]|nr:bis(5'-nucleosyl)-tetraphosphatase (symmetrical) YqeK [Clostridia bacterium]